MLCRSQFVAPVEHIDELMLQVARSCRSEASEQSSSTADAHGEKLEFLWVPASVLVRTGSSADLASRLASAAVGRVARSEFDEIAC